ncbi:O-antigen ligase family protein [Variovorax sp. VNK109]|jgi:O-antigen ligase|uniref:O-antigen ligase family protein n=1 Tax=Variovorax sp. VNK109 TaxID=3400919 RepID=UPI003C0009D6
MQFRFSLDTPSPRLDLWARWLLVAMIFMVPISTAGTNLFKFAMLLCWLLAGGYRARWDVLRRHPLAWAGVALYVVILFSSTYSPAPFDAILFQWSKYNKILFLLPAITLLQDSLWRRRALLAFLAAMGVTLLASYLHVFWAFPGAQATQAGVHGNHYVFKNHIEQNIMMSFFVLACLHGAVMASDLRHRWSLAGLGAAGAVNILFFVNGRTGYLTLAACFIVLVIFGIPARWRWRALSAIVVAGVLAVASSSNLQNRVESVVREVQTHEINGLDTSSGQRIEFWRNSIELLREKPLLGWGTGAYGRAFCSVADNPQWCRIGAESHPHNQTLYLGVESGLLGIIAFWIFQCVPLWLARCYPPTTRLLLVGLTAILWIDGLFNVPLYALTEAFFFLMMFATLTADYPTCLQQSDDAAEQAAQMARNGYQ